MDKYGFNEHFKLIFEEEKENGLAPARIIAEHKSRYRIVFGNSEAQATVSGKFRFEAESSFDAPTVGDYVLVEDSYGAGVIHKILPRKTALFRKDSFNNGIQLICANIDTLFICMSPNRDFNPSRLERYLIMAKESKAKAAVILTKSDLCDDSLAKEEICRAICGDIPVYSVSSVDKRGFDEILPYFSKGQTVAAVGSSGVGKSTLVNSLFGEDIMKTAEVREDDQRGRHTTVHRQIILLPSGGLYLDTPGLREVGIAGSADGISGVFSDIEGLMGCCRYSNCTHTKEDGCAVLAAIHSGDIAHERYEKYLKIQKEAFYYEDKTTFMRQRAETSKQIAKSTRNRKKHT